MWGVLQQGISTLDVDFRGYAAEHFDRLLANAATPRFEHALGEVGRRLISAHAPAGRLRTRASRPVDPQPRPSLRAVARDPSSLAVAATLLVAWLLGAAAAAGAGDSSVVDGSAPPATARRSRPPSTASAVVVHGDRRRPSAIAPSPTSRRPSRRRARPPPDPILIGAGDIATCDHERRRADRQAGRRQRGHRVHARRQRVRHGSPAEFRDCYDPTWGRVKDRTELPVPGNHDYDTPNAAGYRDYFGQPRDPRRRHLVLRATSATGT